LGTSTGRDAAYHFLGGAHPARFGGERKFRPTLAKISKFETKQQLVDKA
jgi:hypothetical protein